MDHTIQTNIFFLDEALKYAVIAASQQEVPVGAVLVQNGVIIGTGYNTREGQCDPLGHAELHALQASAAALSSWRLLNATLYVTLEPCVMCLAACIQARIAHIVYAAKDPKGGALSLGYRLHEDKRLHHQLQISFHEDPRASALLREFFRRLRA